MKKFISLCFCLVLMLGWLTPTFSTSDVSTAGSSGDTPIQLTADATAFSVTVPTSIPVAIDKNVVVHCPDNLYITNNSAGSVMVTGIEMQNGAWSLTNYNNGDRSIIAGEKVDSNQIGFSLTPDGGSMSQTVSNGTQGLNIIPKEWIINGDGGNLHFDVAAISTAIKDEILTPVNASNVVFTIGWYKEESHGVYFNYPYTCENYAGVEATVMIHDDYSVDVYFDGSLTEQKEAGYVYFNGNDIYYSEDDFPWGKVSNDGSEMTVYIQDGTSGTLEIVDSFVFSLNKTTHDIYFGEVYSFNSAGTDVELLLHEDGSFECYVNGVQNNFGITNLEYVDNKIVDADSNAVIAYVSLDGTQIVSPLWGSILVKGTQLQSGIYFNQPYTGTLPDEAGDKTVSAVFYRDGSVEKFQENISVSGTTLKVNYIGNEIVDKETGDIIGTVSEDGSKVTSFFDEEEWGFSQLEFVLDTEKHNIYFGDYYSVSADGNTIEVILYENGSIDMWVNGAKEDTSDLHLTYGNNTIVESSSLELVGYVSLDGRQIVMPGAYILTKQDAPSRTTLVLYNKATDEKITVSSDSTVDVYGVQRNDVDPDIPAMSKKVYAIGGECYDDTYQVVSLDSFVSSAIPFDMSINGVAQELPSVFLQNGLSQFLMSLVNQDDPRGGHFNCVFVDNVKEQIENWQWLITYPTGDKDVVSWTIDKNWCLMAKFDRYHANSENSYESTEYIHMFLANNDQVLPFDLGSLILIVCDGAEYVDINNISLVLDIDGVLSHCTWGGVHVNELASVNSSSGFAISEAMAESGEYSYVLNGQDTSIDFNFRMLKPMDVISSIVYHDSLEGCTFEEMLADGRFCWRGWETAENLYSACHIGIKDGLVKLLDDYDNNGGQLFFLNEDTKTFTPVYATDTLTKDSILFVDSHGLLMDLWREPDLNVTIYYKSTLDDSILDQKVVSGQRGTSYQETPPEFDEYNRAWGESADVNFVFDGSLVSYTVYYEPIQYTINIEAPMSDPTLYNDSYTISSGYDFYLNSWSSGYFIEDILVSFMLADQGDYQIDLESGSFRILPGSSSDVDVTYSFAPYLGSILIDLDGGSWVQGESPYKDYSYTIEDDFYITIKDADITKDGYELIGWYVPMFAGDTMLDSYDEMDAEDGFVTLYEDPVNEIYISRDISVKETTFEAHSGHIYGDFEIKAIWKPIE